MRKTIMAMYWRWVEEEESRGWEGVSDLLPWSPLSSARRVCPAARTVAQPHPARAPNPSVSSEKGKACALPVEAFALRAMVSAPHFPAAPSPQPHLHHHPQLPLRLGARGNIAPLLLAVLFLSPVWTSRWTRSANTTGHHLFHDGNDLGALDCIRVGRGTSGRRPRSFASFPGRVQITEAMFRLTVHIFCILIPLSIFLSSSCWQVRNTVSPSDAGSLSSRGYAAARGRGTGRDLPPWPGSRRQRGWGDGTKCKLFVMSPNAPRLQQPHAGLWRYWRWLSLSGTFFPYFSVKHQSPTLEEGLNSSPLRVNLYLPLDGHF